jgi:hypothetical protein
MLQAREGNQLKTLLNFPRATTKMALVEEGIGFLQTTHGVHGFMRLQDERSGRLYARFGC